MSFNKFSVSQTASNKNEADDKTKPAPAGGKPAAQPVKEQTEAAPAQKS